MASRRILLRTCQNELMSRTDTSRKMLKLGRFLNHIRREASSMSRAEKPQFGFLFDIDGVIVRGKKVLPTAREAFRMLTDDQGKFRVPALFVTNAGNTLRQKKAEQLSDWLQIEINQDQVVMSHSPLKMFRQFHDKRALISGQGPIEEIAQGLGFNNTVTVDHLRNMFPHLDMVDHRRRKAAPCAFEEYFPPIEVIILFGEPVRWETNLQLIADVLITNGKPCRAPSEIPYPHLPVLGCNMDLLWMSEACMPRFGHGCFLNCLESVYQKITGHELKYTALVGKPGEITYHHADYLLCQQARQMGIERVRKIYCIGDNPETDIYGANLYNRYLAKRFQTNPAKKMAVPNQGDPYFTDSGENENEDPAVDMEDGNEKDLDKYYIAESCASILVCTGVYVENHDYVQFARTKRPLNHNHRDFVIDPELKTPHHVSPHVLDAVQTVFDLEKFK